MPSQNLNLSIVDEKKLQRDPRRLAFLRPNLPLFRFREMTDDYYKSMCLKAAEEVAMICGNVLVPSSCMNKKRRDPQRRVMLFGRTYYILHESEMTNVEKEKYRSVTG
jgi:hypothetical protein